MHWPSGRTSCRQLESQGHGYSLRLEAFAVTLVLAMQGVTDRFLLHVIVLLDG